MNDPHPQNLTDKLMLPGVALFICAGMTFAFWPGVGTWEVLQFALQRKLPVMNDWKSPFVTQIYWIADYFFNNTGPILLLQQALFWSGLALLTRSTFQNTIHGSIFFLVVASLPPVWISEILLWKEAWTLSFLTLSLGTIFAYIQNGKVWFVMIAVLSAILLTATRHNAIFLALPAFYIGAQLIANRTARKASNHHRLIGITAFLVLAVFTLSVNWAVNEKGKQRCHIWHHALLWDLAALSLFEGKMLIPEAFRKKGEVAPMIRIQAYFTYTNESVIR